MKKERGESEKERARVRELVEESYFFFYFFSSLYEQVLFFCKEAVYVTNGTTCFYSFCLPSSL